MATPKRSPLEGKTGSVSDQEQQQSLTNQNTAQGSLSQFEGPVDQSPFYKALKTAGTSGVSDAYQSARASTADRAKQAGFGYEQPVAQGADAQVQNQEAKAQAQVPGQALIAATGPELAATAQTAGIGATQAGTGVAYSGQEVGLEEQFQQQQFQQQQAMWQALQQAGGQLIDANPGDIFG